MNPEIGFIEVISGGTADINALGGRSHLSTQLRQSLQRWASNWYASGWQGIKDWEGVYHSLREKHGDLIERMLRQELEMVGVAKPNAKTLADAVENQMTVGKILIDLDHYIATAEVINDPQAVHSVAMARLLREYIADEIKIYQASQKTVADGNKNLVKDLRTDFSNMRDGAQWERFIDSHNSLSRTMQAIASTYEEGTFQRKVADFLARHARANDIHIQTRGKREMKNATGWYIFNSGTIEIRRGMPVDALFKTVMHEATHVYTSRITIRYKNWLSEKHQNPKALAKDFGLSESEVRFLQHAEKILDVVRNKPANPIGKFRKIAGGPNNVPYGASFHKNSSVDLAEFFAELYSNDTFRMWVEEEISNSNRISKKKARTWLKDLVKSFFDLFGIETGDRPLEQFLDHGFKLWDRAAWVTRSAPVNKLRRAGAMDDMKDARTRAGEDFEYGVRYYTFKTRKAWGSPELSGSARFDEELNAWEIQYADAQGQVQTVSDLTIDEVMDVALANDMEVYSRSTLDGQSHYLTEQIQKLRMVNPRLAGAIERLRFFLMNFMSEAKVNNAVGHIYEWALNFEHYAMNRDALHIWIERALRAAGKSPENAQRIINDIQAKTVTFMNERGLDQQSFYDHKIAITEMAKQYGVTLEELNDMVYALTAKHRKELFDKEPGEINPYTGKPVRDGSLVSGFEWTDANGKKIKDDDGSKYLGQLTPDKIKFVQLLEQKWIEQNNALLDLELQAGAISRSQYEAQYGLFYAPLRNVDDQASAFYKRALGRTTRAKDPATNYYNFAQARANYAQHQLKNKALLRVALTENVQSIIEVNQVHFVQAGDALKKSWRGANLQDPAVMTVWDGDKQYVMRITDENIANIIRRADARQVTPFWNTLSNVTRWLSTVRTSLSPTFVPMAFARDILTSIGNVQGAFRDMGGMSLTDAQAREISMRIPARAMTAAMSILKGKATGVRSWEYDVFKRAGGGITMNARFDFEQANDWLKQELRTAEDGTTKRIGTGLRRGKQAIHKAMEISHAFEDAVRFATFMEYVELRNGGRKFNSEKEMIEFLRNNNAVRTAAVSGSKNITGNFEIKGSNVGWRAAYMFFNASMVGLSTTVNMFDPRHGKHGYQYAMMMAGLMLASIALTDADLGDDEDGKSGASRVGKLGDSICVGGFCIGVPHEVRPITNMVAATYFTAKGDYSVGEASAKVMHGILQGGSPFQFDSFSTADNQAHILMQNLMPTIGELPLQLATGYNSFGKEIMPEYAYTANGQRIIDAEDWQKTKMTDPEWTKWLAMNGRKWLGIDVSSSEIDHTAQFIFGSIYTSLKKAGAAAMQGESLATVGFNFMGRSFAMDYNERAQINEAREQLRKLKAELSMGDDPTNMIRSSTELKADPRYARLVALEKRIENAEKSLRFNGKSYAELYRQKQQGVLTNNLDDILEANEGIEQLTQERREIWADFYDELDDISGDY